MLIWGFASHIMVKKQTYWHLEVFVGALGILSCFKKTLASKEKPFGKKKKSKFFLRIIFQSKKGQILTHSFLLSSFISYIGIITPLSSVYFPEYPSQYRSCPNFDKFFKIS